MACLERLLEYLHLPQEAAPPPKAAETKATPTTLKDGMASDVDGDWPADGSIEFKDVNLRYRPDLPFVLHDFSARINAKEKTGIVGRTGAGKSSLILALFRLVELDSGTIIIDRREASKMSLNTLRRAITIIPQDPVLHQGSVAHNLDPFGESEIEKLQDAVERVGLPRDIVGEEVAKGGSNFSSGERQLFCFARAILHRRTILVLDEATSNLDEKSDQAIQDLLRAEFANMTVLTIAHRCVTFPR